MAIDKITTASITDANITTAKIASGVLPANTPTFLVYKVGDQSISANTDTKITSWTEIFDPQNTFASNKFTPGVSGKYYIYGYVYFQAVDTGKFVVRFKKNGSTFVESGSIPGSSSHTYPQLCAGYIELDTNDYVEMYAQGTNNTSAYSSGDDVQWGAYKIIE